MKKKIMGVILAATLIVSQAVTAFAGSKTSEVVLPNDFAAYYTVTEGTREAFAEAEAVSPQTVDAIIEVNNGSMTLAQLVADMKELLKAEGAAGLKMTEEQVDALAADLGSRTFVTKFFDLEPVNGGIKDDNAAWEVVEASDVDYTNKEITASFKDLSPVAVIAKVDTSADNAIGTSPQTGRFPVSVLWIGAAVILGATGVIVLRKRKEK